MSGPQVNGRLVDFSPPPAVWATTLIQIYVKERSAGLHTSTRHVSYMNTFEGTEDWHKCMLNTRGTYIGLTTMHRPTDVHRAVAIIPLPLLPPPYSEPRVGWRGPSRSELLTHSCTCCLPPDCCSSALFRERTHTGFHTGEVAECRMLLISLLRAVVLLTSDKCNSNLASLFSPMN